MSQSKRHSAIETATNTAVGFVGSYFITLACLHAPGSLATQTLYATLGCTAWSLLRGYFLRRWFNHLHVKRVAAELGMEVRKVDNSCPVAGVHLFDNHYSTDGLTRCVYCNEEE